MGAEIFAVIIAEMVVACYGCKLDASIDEKVNQSRLHFGLPGLEVIAADKRAMLFSELDCTRDEGVLWRPIDKWSVLKYTSHSEDGRWSYLLMTSLYGSHEIVRGVIDAREEISKTFSVGSPLNNDFIKAIFRLKVTAKISR